MRQYDGVSGWDNPRDRYELQLDGRRPKWHWYEGASPVCGSDAGLSPIDQRVKVLPIWVSRVCKRCKKKVGKNGRPMMQIVK